MVTLYLPDGTPKHFAHEIDAMEWAASGAATVEPPAGAKAVETPVEEKAKPATTYHEAVEQFEAPDVQVSAPAPAAKPAPRRRKSAES